MTGAAAAVLVATAGVLRRHRRYGRRHHLADLLSGAAGSRRAGAGRERRQYRRPGDVRSRRGTGIPAGTGGQGRLGAAVVPRGGGWRHGRGRLAAADPCRVVRRIVPYLVALGSVALLVQPRVSALRDGHGRGRAAVLLAGLLVIGAYSGYFGAGSGVLTLALLLFTVDSQLARANALKNVIVGVATASSALILVLAGPVDWTVVLPLAAGLFTGSLIGPKVARRVPAGILRWLVVLVGLGLAAWPWAH